MTVIVGRRCSAGVSECSVLSNAKDLKGDKCQVFPVPPHPGDGCDEVNIEGPLWVKYVKGVVALLNKDGDVPPFEAVVTTCVPLGGGVSSSAALEVAMGLFVKALLGTEVIPMDLALICQEAEHRYAGVCEHVCVHVHAYVCVHMYHVCVCVYMCMRVCAHVHAGVCTCACVCVHMCMRVCAHVDSPLREQVWYHGPVCVSHGQGRLCSPHRL